MKLQKLWIVLKKCVINKNVIIKDAIDNCSQYLEYFKYLCFYFNRRETTQLFYFLIVFFIACEVFVSNLTVKKINLFSQSPVVLMT